MANIFDDLEVGKSVFKDKQPLDHRFLPENLPHRKEQITQIAKYWIEALNNVTPSDITIYGKTGTGIVNGNQLNGWFVGFVESKGKVFAFATNIQGKVWTDGATAKNITLSILKDKNIL